MVIFYGIIILTFLWVITQINAIISFSEEQKYIKMEIKRSQSEETSLLWKKRLKILYLTSIPIVGRLLKKWLD